MSAKLVMRGLNLVDSKKEATKKTKRKKNHLNYTISKSNYKKGSTLDMYERNIKCLIKEREKKDVNNQDMEKILNYLTSDQSRRSKYLKNPEKIEESDFTESDMNFKDYSELFNDDENDEDSGSFENMLQQKKKKKKGYVRKR